LAASWEIRGLEFPYEFFQFFLRLSQVLVVAELRESGSFFHAGLAGIDLPRVKIKEKGPFFPDLAPHAHAENKRRDKTKVTSAPPGNDRPSELQVADRKLGKAGGDPNGNPPSAVGESLRVPYRPCLAKELKLES